MSVTPNFQTRMTDTVLDAPSPAPRAATPWRLLKSLVNPVARRAVLAAFRRIHTGSVTVEERGRRETFGNAAGPGPHATLAVHDPDFYRAAAFAGSIGAGESYIAGHWHADDLVALMNVFARNRDAYTRLDGALTALVAPTHRLTHILARNTRAGSRRNIAAHYDLGNEFFAAWLDETMMYSAAVWPTPDASLAQAQRHKIDLLCRSLDLRPQDHLLEIGTGWGHLALHAAREFGCRVTTTTISREQAELARRRVAEAGLEDRVNVLERDYRDLTGRFDKIVSVEMIEAVGYSYLPAFFSVCAARLRPGGLMALQAIVIDPALFRQTVHAVDFIKKHVFPGSFIPSIPVLVEAAAKHGPLRLVACEDFGTHYARTLAEWRGRFHAAADAVAAMGYTETFRRMWDFYLAYCEAGFACGQLGVVQMLLQRPHANPRESRHS